MSCKCKTYETLSKVIENLETRVEALELQLLQQFGRMK